MVGISQGLMGQALAPKLSATGSVPTATQEASAESGNSSLSEDELKYFEGLGLTPSEAEYFVHHNTDFEWLNNVLSKPKDSEGNRMDISSDNFVEFMQGLAAKGNKDALDWLVNYYSTWEANKWAAQRDDTAYQRLNKDLLAAGISPYVLSGATPQISSVKMPDSSSFASTANNKRSRDSNDRGNVMQMIGYGLLTAGRIIAAII